MKGSKSRMQGKESLEQGANAKCSVGIDVSKSWLDVHVLPCEQTLRVSNTMEGIRKLKRRIATFDPALVVVEATGKWHRQVQRSLFASGIKVAAVDPYRVRMFAKAQGILAKTDRLDARVLALFAMLMAPDVRLPTPAAIEEIKELVVAREGTVGEETSLKNQLASSTCSFLKRHLKRRIVRLAKEIQALDREILKCIRADDGLARRYEILISVPSFGFVVAATLTVCLPELGTCNAKAIAMLAGLAPIADESGERKGARVVWGGRPALRRILYLAALTAPRLTPQFKAFYQRLLAAGKPPKVALIALARKLVILANTLVSQNRIWQPHAPEHA
jgi:transposase